MRQTSFDEFETDGFKANWAGWNGVGLTLILALENTSSYDDSETSENEKGDLND